MADFRLFDPVADAGGGDLETTLTAGNTTGENAIVLNGTSAATRVIRGVDGASPTRVVVRGGNGVGDDGERLFLEGGSGDATNNGGGVFITSGAAATTGSSGDIRIVTPNSTDGSSMELTVGTGTSGEGDLVITAPQVSIRAIAASFTPVVTICGTTSETLAFYGGGGATKQTVTGSRGGNAALASLLTALDALGIITDSSTA